MRIATHASHASSPRRRLGMAGFCAVVAIVTAPAERADASREIPLVREGGVYEVPVTINGWLERPFILDSGASDVQVSADVFLTLYPRGAPAPRFLPGVSYRLADGRVVSSRRFVIPSLRIGDYEFPDAAASIGESGSPLLLGQNVLTRLGTWSIDNRRGVLVLEEGVAGAPSTGCLSWRTAPATCAVAAARDYFRDTRPRHDITSLVLLASTGDRAIVLIDVLRLDDRREPARLCGPVRMRRAGDGWRLDGAPTLREIGRGARCLP
jgi:Aspartyl protease